MLRRNFLKLLGLLPLGLVPKATGGLIKKSDDFVPAMVLPGESVVFSPKHYARIATKKVWTVNTGIEKTYYSYIYEGEFEVELETACHPEIDTLAWVGDNGKITDRVPEFNVNAPNPLQSLKEKCVGIFISKRYTKEYRPISKRIPMVYDGWGFPE